MIDPQEQQRLTRRIELLDDALADARDADEKRQLRNELLDLHRRLDQLSETQDTPRPSTQQAAPAETVIESDSQPHRPAPGSIDGHPPTSAPPAMGAYPDPWSDNYQVRWWNGKKWSARAERMRGPILSDRNRTLRPPQGRDLTEAEAEARKHWSGNRSPGQPAETLPPAEARTVDPPAHEPHDRAAVGSPAPAHEPHDRAAVGSPAPARRTNRAAAAGFVFGLLSIFAYDIGIIPILAVILSVIGLARSDERSGQWMAAVGLILGLLYTFMYLVLYGHITL